jgi:hypothetical protein
MAKIVETADDLENMRIEARQEYRKITRARQVCPIRKWTTP